MLRTDLAYVVIAESGGSPDTIDRVYPFVRDNIDAFGFPRLNVGLCGSTSNVDKAGALRFRKDPML